MPYITRFSRQADKDLLGIGEFIARDNPARAQTYTQELVDYCHKISLTPLAFPIMPERKNIELRKRNYGNYLIFYRVIGDYVQIIRIIHSRRDYLTLI